MAKLWLVLSGLLLFLSSWTLLPAPAFAFLPLSIAAPELSPALMAGNAIALFVALQGYSTPLWRLAVGCSLVGLVLSGLPLLQLPHTLRQADASLAAAMGASAPSAHPSGQALPAQPFAIGKLLTGMHGNLPPIRRDRVPYAAADGSALQLALYRPSTSGRHPTLIALYGGAWQRGTPEQNAAFHRFMAGRGYTVAALSYRHAPGDRFPAQLQDVRAGLNFLRDRAAEFDIDPQRLVLVGWSAGAHLAMLAAFSDPDPAVRGVVNYYGPVDLANGYWDVPRPDPIRVRHVLETLMGGTPVELSEAYRTASPLTYVRAGLPPTLAIYGQRDRIVKVGFGRALYDRLRATGNRAAFVELPWSDHAFDAVFRGLGNQVALYYTERFVATVLNESS